MSKNLLYLLEKRYNWMNSYIDKNSIGADIGSGAGLSEFFIRANKLYLTDIIDNDWLDYKNVNAMKTPFDDNSMDFVIALNVLHHISQPILFFKEMNRILRTNGLLIIKHKINICDKISRINIKSIPSTNTFIIITSSDF